MINKNKLLLFTIITLLTLALSSCSLFYKTYSRDDAKISETRFDEIIEALNNKDSETLKAMFSSNALKEADNIDEDIEYLMDFYKGEIISIESAREGSDSKDGDEREIELRTLNFVSTDEDEYIVFYIDNLTDTKDPDNVGLDMLQIIKQSDRKTQFDWGGDKTYCKGIYRPPTAETTTD